MDNTIEKHNLLKVVYRFFGIPDKTRELGFDERESINTTRKELTDRMKDLELQICGGAVLSTFTNTAVNDLDFYMLNPDKLNSIHAFFLEWFPEDVFITNNATTYKRKGKQNKIYTVQLVTRFSGDSRKIFDTFDFTITQCMYNFSTGDFEFGERFLQDVAKRKLVYSGGSSYPICAMFRTLKYQERGYKLSGATIMHISLSIVRLKIETYGQLKDQLMGIDTMYLQGLLGGEDYMDNLPVDYGKFIHDAFERIDGIVRADEEEEEK